MMNMEKINDTAKEALMMLSCYDKNILDKIPGNVFEKLILLAGDSEIDVLVDPQKDINSQNVSEDCKDLLSLIYYNYVADEKEKLEILNSWAENMKKYC